MNEKENRQLPRRRIALASGIALGVLFFWLAVREVELDSLWTALKSADATLAIFFLPALALYYWLKAVRWRDLLSTTCSASSSDVLPSMMMGIAGNNLLPAHAGELVRVYLASSDLGAPKAALLGTLVAERLMDILAILVLLGGVFAFADVTRELQLAAAFLLVSVSGMTAVIFGLIVYNDASQKFFAWIASLLPEQHQDKVRRQFELLVAGMAVLRDGKMYGRVLASSILQWCLMALCIFLSLQAFGIEAPFYIPFYVLGLLVAGLLLPTSPGFVGTVQICFVIGLKTLSVSPGEAFGASVFYHLILWTTAILSGVFFSWRYGLNWSSVKSLFREEPVG